MPYPTQTIDQVLYRLIPSKFPPIDVYERLLTPELTSVAHGLEALTNPRLAAQRRLLSGKDSARPEQLQNFNHAPFAYKDPGGTHLLPPAYGVMEVAREQTAALAHAILRREAFLTATDEPECHLDMRLLSTPASGDFVDLRALAADAAQEERWAIGRAQYDAGAVGAVFRRPGVLGGDFVAVFDSAVLGHANQTAHYRFRWDGSQVVTVYDYSSGETIPRSTLFASVRQPEPA